MKLKIKEDWQFPFLKNIIMSHENREQQVPSTIYLLTEQTEKKKIASRFISVTEEQILSINEAVVPTKIQKWQHSGLL